MSLAVLFLAALDSAASGVDRLPACSSATCRTLGRFLGFASSLFGGAVVSPAAGMVNRSKRGINSAQSFRNLSTLESMLSNPMLSNPMLGNAR